MATARSRSATCPRSIERGKEKVEVLHHIDLDIEQGRLRRADGPVGLGQDDTAQPDRRARFADRRRDHGRRPAHRPADGAASSRKWRAANVGFVFQFYNLMPMLSAQKNVELPLLLTKLVGGAAQANARHRARSSSAWPIAPAHKPTELSGGQQQRVAIARAIVSDPTLLVCDEPTGDLDRQSAEEMLGLLQQLNREHGKTIVMVTHDPKAAEYATPHAASRQGHAGRTGAAPPEPEAAMKYLHLDLGGAVPAQDAHAADPGLDRRRLPAVRPARRGAHGVRPGGQSADGAERLQTGSQLSFIQPLPLSLERRSRAMPASSDVDLRQLVRRRLPGPAQPGLQLRGRARTTSTSIPEIAVMPRRAQGLRRDAHRRARRRAAGASSSAGRSATRSRCSRRSSRQAAARTGRSRSSASSTSSDKKTGGFFDQMLLLNWKYFDETTPYNQGAVGWYVARAGRREPGRPRSPRRSTRSRPTPTTRPAPRPSRPRRGMDEAARRHRPDRRLDHGRGVLHPAAAVGQHDDAGRARTHQRARGAEDDRLLATAACWGWCWPSRCCCWCSAASSASASPPC